MGCPLLVAPRSQPPLLATLQSARLWSTIFHRRSESGAGCGGMRWHGDAMTQTWEHPHGPEIIPKGHRVTRWLWRDIRVSGLVTKTPTFQTKRPRLELPNAVKLTTSWKWFSLRPFFRLKKCVAACSVSFLYSLIAFCPDRRESMCTHCTFKIRLFCSDHILFYGTSYEAILKNVF